MTRIALLTMLAVPVTIGACGNVSPEARASVVIDSVIPRDEALRRFQAGLPVTTQLSGGAPSRDELVRRFVRALEARDTAALRALTITRAEFAFIYYPTNPQSLPPYDLSPALMWFMLDQRSQQGLGHVLEERGGRKLGAVGYECLGTASIEGENTVWGPCVLKRVQAPGDTVTERLFGQIIGRDGRYKFVSLANKL
jgi:hypothetical protein